MYARLAVGLREQRTGVLGDLLDEFGREIHGVAYLILRNHADAEEVLMDTMVTAWRRSRDLREDGALRIWLLRIATRAALSRRRRARITRPIEEGLSVKAPTSMQPSADRLIVAEAMDALPPQMRAAVALHHVAGMTVAQSAAVLGKSENTIKSQLREALSRLRAALAESSVASSTRTQADARRA